MRLRIVVADQSEARFYDMLGRMGRPVALGKLRNPAARLHDQDLESDRPGRVFNFAASPGRRRGASPRHAANGERSTKHHLVETFAHRVVAELDRARLAKRFDRLILVAPPAFLGMLRRALPQRLRPHAASVARDLINQSYSDVRACLPERVFAEAAGFQPAKRAAPGSIT